MGWRRQISTSGRAATARGSARRDRRGRVRGQSESGVRCIPIIAERAAGAVWVEMALHGERGASGGRPAVGCVRGDEGAFVGAHGEFGPLGSQPEGDKVELLAWDPRRARRARAGPQAW